jgi:hypothetical protein
VGPDDYDPERGRLILGTVSRAVIDMKTICRVGKDRPVLIFLLLMQLAIPTGAGPITLPLPIFLETFDAVAEGSLPTGWYALNFSDLPQTNFNLVDLNSASYAGWLVVDRQLPPAGYDPPATLVSQRVVNTAR